MKAQPMDAGSARIGVLRRFVSVKPSVRAAEHDDLPAATEFRGEIVGAERIDGPGRDGHDINRRVEVNRGDQFINKADIPVGGSERSQIWQRQWDEITVPGAGDSPILAGFIIGGLND